MTVLDCKRTNIWGDTEVSGRSPDAEGDFYHITDGQQDANYIDCVISDLPAMISNDPTEEFMILYGGVVSDGGSGTINISAGVAKGKDSGGNRKLIYIPALTGVALPSGWNNDRQIWVVLKYDFKLSTATRTHRAGVSYHYQIENTYLGDSNGESSTGSSDLFVDSDPTGTAVILGSFKMNGTTFTDMNVRTLTYDKSLLEKIYPVGSFYVQYPDAASNTDATAFPTAYRPATLFGGTWVEQFNTENVFFRTAGTDYQARSAGLSLDEFQAWQLGATADGTGAKNYWGGAGQRDLRASGTVIANDALPYLATAIQGSASRLKAMNDGTNGDPRTGAVTEPRNRLMKVWKRTAL